MHLEKLKIIFTLFCFSGHGPYSHLWEGFVKQAGHNWHHEATSIQMLDYLIKDNNLMEVFSKEPAETRLDEQDILFIKEQIAGPISPETGLPYEEGKEPATDSTEWPYRGRGVEKSFLYEIVANKISGKQQLVNLSIMIVNKRPKILPTHWPNIEGHEISMFLSLN